MSYQSTEGFLPKIMFAGAEDLKSIDIQPMVVDGNFYHPDYPPQILRTSQGNLIVNEGMKILDRDVVINHTAQKAWEILFSENEFARKVRIVNFEKRYEEAHPNIRARYTPPAKGEEIATIEIPKNWKMAAEDLRKPEYQPLLEYYASSLGLRPDLLTDGIITAIILLHEFGHHEYRNLNSNQKHELNTGQRKAVLPVKNYDEFVRNFPKASWDERMDFIKKYKSQPEESYPDNYAFSFLKRHPELIK